MITVTFKAKDYPGNTLNLFDSFIRELQDDSELIKKQLSELGGETALKMILCIQENKVRPQNGMPATLEHNINCENFSDGGWGVGNIEDLNQNAPWWPAINWGSSHMVGRRVPNGSFDPGIAHPTPDAFRDGRWIKGTGHWSFIVHNPIPPMNYIEKTIDWLRSEINKIGV